MAPRWRRATPISAPGALTRISRSMGVLLCLVAGTRCRSSTTRCPHVGVLSVWVCWALLDFVNHFREAQVLAAEARMLSLADSLSAPLHRLFGIPLWVASFHSLRCALHWQLAAAVPRVVPESGRQLCATCAPPVRRCQRCTVDCRTAGGAEGCAQCVPVGQRWVECAAAAWRGTGRVSTPIPGAARPPRCYSCQRC